MQARKRPSQVDKFRALIAEYRAAVEFEARTSDDWSIALKELNPIAPSYSDLVTGLSSLTNASREAHVNRRHLGRLIADRVLRAHGREQHLDPGESLALAVDGLTVVVTTGPAGYQNEKVVSILEREGVVTLD